MVLVQGPCEFAVKTSAGLRSSEGVTGARGCASRMAHSRGSRLEASVACCLLAGGLGFSWQLTVPRASSLRENRAFDDLVSQVVYCHFFFLYSLELSH